VKAVIDRCHATELSRPEDDAMRTDGSFAFAVVCLLAAIGLLLISTPATAAAPPAGRTYFTLLLGLEAPYSWDADCLRFTARDVCTSDGTCGSWERTEQDGQLGGFSMEIAWQQDSVQVRLDGQVRVDDRGRKDTIAGAMRMRLGNKASNFGFTGRSTSKKNCRRLLWDWDSRNPAVEQAEQNPECLARADFRNPASSPYVLPFPVGKSYNLSQTYCFAASSHSNEYAYDFDIPLGEEIIAARAGEVVEVIEHLPNDEPWPENNRLQIRHDDGTVARYLHVAQDSIVPEVGDRVERGEVIALSAMSGTIDPHLHFAVYRDYPGVNGQDVSVNFRNAGGPIDERFGLIHGVSYTALP
jgi:hypothetical protein